MDFEPVEGFPAITSKHRQFKPAENDNSLIANFIEYRGEDKPPVSLGNPGDIYIDKSTSILYACYDFPQVEDRWFPWCSTKIEGTTILEHPVYRDSILWVSADVSWVRKRRLENRFRNTRLLKTPKELVKALLQSKTKLKSVKKPARFIDNDDSLLVPATPSDSAPTSISQQPSRTLPDTKKVPISQRSTLSVPPIHVADAERLDPLIGVNFISGGKEADSSRKLYEENEMLKRKLKEMEEENARLRGSQSQANITTMSTSTELPPLHTDLTLTQGIKEKLSNKSGTAFPSPPPSARPLSSSSKSMSRSVSEVLAATAANTRTYRSPSMPEPGLDHERSVEPPPPFPQTQPRTPVLQTGTMTTKKAKPRLSSTIRAAVDGVSGGGGGDKGGKTPLKGKRSSKPLRVLSSPSASPSPSPPLPPQDRISMPSPPLVVEMDSSAAAPRAGVSPSPAPSPRLSPSPPFVPEPELEPEPRRVQERKRKRLLDGDSEKEERADRRLKTGKTKPVVPVVVVESPRRKKPAGIASPIDQKRKLGVKVRVKGNALESPTTTSTTTTRRGRTTHSLTHLTNSQVDEGSCSDDESLRGRRLDRSSDRDRSRSRSLERRRRREDSTPTPTPTSPPLKKRRVLGVFRSTSTSIETTSRLGRLRCQEEKEEEEERNVPVELEGIKRDPDEPVSASMARSSTSTSTSTCVVGGDKKQNVIDLTLDSDSDSESQFKESGSGGRLSNKSKAKGSVSMPIPMSSSSSRRRHRGSGSSSTTPRVRSPPPSSRSRPRPGSRGKVIVIEDTDEDLDEDEIQELPGPGTVGRFDKSEGSDEDEIQEVSGPVTRGGYEGRSSDGDVMDEVEGEVRGAVDVGAGVVEREGEGEGEGEEDIRHQERRRQRPVVGKVEDGVGPGGCNTTPFLYPSGTSRDASMMEEEEDGFNSMQRGGGEETEMEMDLGLDVDPVDGDGDGDMPVVVDDLAPLRMEDEEVKVEVERSELGLNLSEEKRRFLIQLMYYESGVRKRKERCLVCRNTNTDDSKLRNWKNETVVTKLEHYEREHMHWFSQLMDESEEELRERVEDREREIAAVAAALAM